MLSPLKKNFLAKVNKLIQPINNILTSSFRYAKK